MMKKQLLSITALLGLSSIVSAQITITSADFPSVGDMAILVSDTTPTAMPGSAGAGQTWNLGNFNQHSVDTNNFVDPSTTVNASEFPSSNIAVENNAGTFYFSNTSDSSTVDGLVISDFLGVTQNSIIKLSPKELILTFPSVLGTSFSSASGSNFLTDASVFNQPGITNTDSVRLVRTATKTSNIDGEGTVTTPAGQFSALREYSEEISSDSVYIYLSNPFIAAGAGLPANQWVVLPSGLIPEFNENPRLDTTRTYTWYANGEAAPVAEIDVDYNGDPVRATYLYKGNLLVSVINETNASCSASCDGSAQVDGTGGVTSAYTYAWSDGSTSAVATALCSGAYSVTVMDGINTVVSTGQIGEDLVWSASIALSGSSATANANGGTSPYTYLWDDGQTTQTVDNISVGNHDVTVTDVNGCTATASRYVSGIFDSRIEELFSIYPNPTSGSVTISGSTNIETIEVYNMLGATIVQLPVNQTGYSFDLTGQDQGIYFVKIKTEKGIAIKRMVYTH